LFVDQLGYIICFISVSERLYMAMKDKPIFPASSITAKSPGTSIKPGVPRKMA
jgi:hypothetical protein